MMFARSIAGLTLSLWVISNPGFAQNAANLRTVKGMEKLRKLDAAHYAETAVVKSDRKGPIATISTANGYVTGGSDNYLRAFVDKKSGSVTYDLFTAAVHPAVWHVYNSATIEVGDKLQTVPATPIGRDTNCNSYNCTYLETASFKISEEQFNDLSDRGEEPGGAALFLNYRLDGVDGTFNGTIQASEFAGLRRAIRAFKTTPVSPN